MKLLTALSLSAALILGQTLIVNTTVANEQHRPKAHKQTRDPGVNTRQHNQQHRVKDGVKSGELTKEEAKALREERRAIREKERAYKADGKLTKDERKDLHQDLNDSSKHIYEEKHDAEKR